MQSPPCHCSAVMAMLTWLMLGAAFSGLKVKIVDSDANLVKTLGIAKIKE